MIEPYKCQEQERMFFSIGNDRFYSDTYVVEGVNFSGQDVVTIKAYNTSHIPSKFVDKPKKKIPVKYLVECVDEDAWIVSQLDGRNYDAGTIPASEIEYINDKPYYVEWL